MFYNDTPVYYDLLCSLGNAAGITLGFRSQILHHPATTGDLLNGAAIQLLHPAFPYNFEKLFIPGQLCNKYAE